MLIDQIKADSLEARKQNSKAPTKLIALRTNLIGTLYAEALKVGKDDGNRPSTDEEVLAVVRKFLKNLDEAVTVLTKNGKDVTDQLAEKAILETYLPQQMTREQLAEAVRHIVEPLPDKSAKAMGEVMKQLKDRFGGQYDGKTASEVVRSFLS